MDNKQYAVLGLGIFGSTVATTLANHGCEVIVIDKDPICVQRIADEVTKAIVGDVTDIEELQAAGIGDSDVAIVAIGTHLEEAVLATMNLKELGIPYVIAKAKNKKPNEKTTTTIASHLQVFFIKYILILATPKISPKLAMNK